MEMQSSFIHTSMPKSSPIYIIVGIIGTIIFLTFSAAAQAPVKVTVDAGKQFVIRPDKAVNRSREQFDSVPGGIAVGSINSNGQLVIEGLAPGNARIVFSGTLRAIDIAAPNELAVPFKAIYDVTVLPRNDVDFKVRPLSISKGGEKPFSIGYLMSPGQEFYERNAENVKWRNLRYTRGDDSVATGNRTVDGNEIKLILKGISNGRTSLTLRGERKVGNTWRPVERRLDIKVGTGVKPRDNAADNANNNAAEEFNGEESKPAAEADAEANDAVIEAMARRLEQLQVTGSKADLEQFVDYLKQEIKKEIERRPTRRNRLARLEMMFEQASNELRTAKESEKTEDKKSSYDGIWRLFVNGQRQPGEYRFIESPGLPLLTSGSRPWLLVFGLKSERRRLELPASARDELGFARRFKELRGDARTGRLEFWLTADEFTQDFKKSDYELVRDNP